MYFFFDTETTGIPRDYKAPATNLQNWPRIVQIAWLVTDENAGEITSAEYIVRPADFVIPMDATRIHGITTEMALQKGVALDVVLTSVMEAMSKVEVLVAHNMDFDEKILGAELLRCRYPNVVEVKKRRCTMRETTAHCRLPGPYGYKWPTLNELHKTLFGLSFAGAHSALADVRACARCFFELKRLHVM